MKFKKETETVMKFKISNGVETQKKDQTVKKLKHSNCNKTQKLKLSQNSKTQIVT